MANMLRSISKVCKLRDLNILSASLCSIFRYYVISLSPFHEVPVVANVASTEFCNESVHFLAGPSVSSYAL